MSRVAGGDARIPPTLQGLVEGEDFQNGDSDDRSQKPSARTRRREPAHNGRDFKAQIGISEARAEAARRQY